MPYAQFLKMWDKSRPLDPRVPGKPPVNAVITEAAYSGKIAGDVAQLEVNLTVQVLGKPWVEVPIQFGEAAIGKMTASDDKVLLQATGNGTYGLLFPKIGEHKVKLELTTRVRTSPDGRSLELDCPPAGITTFDLTVPAGDQTVEITPVAIVTPQAGDDKTTHIKANLGATKKIAARWRPRLSTAPVMEVLATVHNTLDVRIADGLVHTHATLVYQVLRGQVDQLRIGVPLDHRILDVTGVGLKSWKAAKEAKMQVVTVDLLGGDSKSIAVEVHTERPVPDGAVELVGVDDTGVYRGIHALGELRARTESSSSASRPISRSQFKNSRDWCGSNRPKFLNRFAAPRASSINITRRKSGCRSPSNRSNPGCWSISARSSCFATTNCNSYRRRHTPSKRRACSNCDSSFRRASRSTGSIASR